jgi:hypothetical protein
MRFNQLVLANNQLVGEGQDDIGSFTLSGTYSLESSTCK